MKKSTKQKAVSVTAKILAAVLAAFLLFGSVAMVLFYII